MDFGRLTSCCSGVSGMEFSTFGDVGFEMVVVSKWFWRHLIRDLPTGV
jgi:hypothetical protein